MSLANVYALPKENNPGPLPVVCGQSLAMEKSCLIDCVPVSDQHYLQDHRVAGKVMYPAAGFVMAGITVHRALRAPASRHKPMVLENLKFRRALSLSSRDKTVLQLSYKPERGEFTVDSGRPDCSGTATLHAVGMLAGSNPELSACDNNLDALFRRCSETISVSHFYQRLSQSGLEYGSFFKRIVYAQVSRDTGEAVTRLSSHPGLTSPANQQARSITLLDGAFQSLAAVLETDQFNLYVPARIRTLRVNAGFEPNLFCYARLEKLTNRSIVGDITIFNAAKRVLLDIRGLSCLRIPQSKIERCNAAVNRQEKSPPENNNVHQQLSATTYKD